MARTGEKERTTWKSIWKDSININIKEIRRDCVNWVHVA